MSQALTAPHTTVSRLMAPSQCRSVMILSALLGGLSLSSWDFLGSSLDALSVDDQAHLLRHPSSELSLKLLLSSLTSCQRSSRVRRQRRTRVHRSRRGHSVPARSKARHRRRSHARRLRRAVCVAYCSCPRLTHSRVPVAHENGRVSDIIHGATNTEFVAKILTPAIIFRDCLDKLQILLLRLWVRIPCDVSR